MAEQEETLVADRLVLAIDGDVGALHHVEGGLAVGALHHEDVVEVRGGGEGDEPEGGEDEPKAGEGGTV